MTLAAALFCQISLAQDAPAGQPPAADASAAAAKDTRGDEFPNTAPRAAPSDYQASAKAGNVTIAADFPGHSVPTPQAVFTSEDYVVVEVGLFGSPDAKLALSVGDFALRINGRKVPVSAEPYAVVFPSLKDPEWEPVKPKGGGGSGISTGGGNDNTPPPTPKMPIELKRVMQQRVQKASLREGERTLPEAGLLFFEHRGKVANMKSVELVYSGPAGKVTIALHP